MCRAALCAASKASSQLTKPVVRTERWEPKGTTAGAEPDEAQTGDVIHSVGVCRCLRASRTVRKISSESVSSSMAPRQGERSDQRADSEDGLASSVVAVAEHALEAADVSLDQSVVAAADVIVAAVDVAGQRRDGTARSGVVAVLR